MKKMSGLLIDNVPVEQTVFNAMRWGGGGLLNVDGIEPFTYHPNVHMSARGKSVYLTWCLQYHCVTLSIAQSYTQLEKLVEHISIDL